MVLTASTTFTNANTPDGAWPIYVVKFGDLLGVSIDTYYSTGPVKGLTTSQILHDRPQLADANVQPLEGQSSIGNAKFELLDVDGAVQELISTYILIQRDVTIYLMYSGQPWGDQMTRFTGQVSNISRNSDGNSFTFSVSSRLGLIDVDILKEEDINGEYYTGSSRTWTQSHSIAGYAKLVLSKADSDTDFYDTVTLTGNPINIALCLMNSGSGDGGDYDIFPAWAGASIPESYIDLTKWESARDDQLALVSMRFTLTDTERLKAFIETEICKVLGGYLLVSGDGKIGCKFFEAPRTTDDLESFDDSTIVDRVKWDSNASDYVSHITFSMDHDGDDFQTVLPTRCSPEYLEGRYFIPRPLVIESRGLQTDLGGLAVTSVVLATIFRRYGTPPPKVDFSAFFCKNLSEPGDVITVQSVTYPNLERPTPLGFNEPRILEIISAKVQKDRVVFSCLDFSLPLQGGERLAIIAPDTASFPAYTAATEAQKAYAFLCSADTREMSNGDPPYIWS